MLSRIRKIIEPLTWRIGTWLGGIVPEPNILTLIGLLLSVTVPVLAFYSMFTAGLIVMVASALFDFLDGAVAKALDKRTLFGAFLDSLSDRVSDFCYSVALWFAGVNVLYVMLYIVTAYLISYVRARAEALGVRLEGVGVMERGERVLFLIIIFTIIVITGSPLIPTYILIVTIFLNLITIIQRVYYTYRGLIRK